MLCQEQGYPEGVSSVTVYAAGGFCNVENHGGNTPEQVLGSVADAMAKHVADFATQANYVAWAIRRSGVGVVTRVIGADARAGPVTEAASSSVAAGTPASRGTL